MDRVSPTSPEPDASLSSEDGREPVERMADEYLERVRRGERPRVDEYVALLPERAEEIRDLFSALLMVEDLKPQTGDLTIRPGSGPDLRSRQPLDRLGDYRILREVGRGGMGIVYEAEQESLGRRVALKLLAPWTRPGPNYLLRFQREARSAARLHHPNIVPIFGVGEHQGLHYYAMQFIQGIGLDQVLKEVVRLRRVDRIGTPREEPDRQSTGDSSTNASATLVAASLVTGRFAPTPSYQPDPVGKPLAEPRPASPEAPPSPSPSSIVFPGDSDLSSATDSVGQYARSVARIGVQVADALAYAHDQGMVHRDVKPSNLLLDCHGNVWVTDFGLVKAIDDADLTHTGDLVGTLRYMAPERFSGQCTPLSDVYSLGLTLYELLVLRPAFDALDRNCLIHQISQELPPPLRKQDPGVPRDLETIIHKAIEKSPQDRYATAAHLAQDLKRWLVHEPIQARPSGPVERVVKWARRNPAPALLAFVSALTLAALIASLLVGYVEVNRGLYREQRASYFQRVALAERAWSGNDVGRAEELLDSCHPGLRGWEWHYLKRLCHSDLLTLRAHEGLEPNAVAFSPDGTILAMAGESGQVTLRDPATGRVLGTLSGHPGPQGARGVYDIAFSADGRLMATAGGDRTVRLWDVASRLPLDVAPLIHSAAVLSVAFSPDGTRLATASGDFWRTSAGADSTGELLIWDVATGDLENCLEGHAGTVHQAAFSPDGTQLASAGADHTVQVWDVATGSWLRTLRGHMSGVTGVAFGPGGQLASAGLDGTLRIWDTVAGVSLTTFREPDERFYAIAFSPDGSRLAAAGRSWAVTLWDATSGVKMNTFRGHAREVTGVAFGRGGRLASAGYDGLVKAWDTTRGQEARTVDGKAGPLLALVFSPDGQRVAAAGYDGPVPIVESATGRAAVDLADEAPRAHRALAYSPDGTALVAAWSPAGTVSIRDAATGRQRRALRAHRGEVTALACSPDGRLLATGGADGAVTVRDLPGGKERVRYAPGPLPITALAFSPSGLELAAATGDSSDSKAIATPGEVTIRNLATGRVVRRLRGHDGGISDLAYSPDGQRIATASWDRTVGVWNVRTGTKERSLGSRGLLVWAVAFHPDGRRLVAADNVGRMTFWEMESGLEVLTLRGHSDRIYDLAFSPDGRLLASASRDATAKIWDATPLAGR